MISRKKILVVEDNAINRAMLCEILSAQYQVLEAEHGQQALDVLAASSDQISLILLDIVMPVMDGYAFLDRMKAIPAYASIPVIVTTQSDSEMDEVTALSHGATDFVAKPYKPQVILHRVAGIINLRETAAMVNQFQYDRLTGLYSKEFFYQRAREILAQNPDRSYDLVCSDIENFKLINDVFGIPAGDQLLRAVAQQCRAFTEGRGICGRIQADQFICLIEHTADYTDEMFAHIAEELSHVVGARAVTMKWGIYAVEDKRVPVEQMCDWALLAVRKVKGQYGKYFAYYDAALREQLLREQAITECMEEALAGGQFVVYFQPKYRLRDDMLAGAEALVRWIHPEWGFQSPAEFIPLFERNGFITKLDQYVWDKTCAFLRAWDDKGYPELAVSANVSRADIYHADIADVLLRTVRKYGLPPARLHLEITESAYTENPHQIIETVGHLRELGFIIEMDDFGNGYSSLNMLNQMPIDILKLDMKFIQSEVNKPANQGVLWFIMDLARWMHLSVVAEGVETREQLDRLLETGCDYVQGYYFAKPMSSGDFEALIQRQQVAPEGMRQSPRTGGKRQLLLVADEDPQYRAQVKRAFGQRFQVAEALDVAEALRQIDANKEQLAAVLLSITLPQPGGLAVLQALSREKAAWNIPIVVTGPPGETQEDMALELGASDYADKPHTQQSLWRRVLRAMRLTAAQERERMLQEEAYRDFMTGALNRRGWEAAAAALRKEDAPLAVYLFDLDDMKRINDVCGHEEGDRLIRAFIQLLRQHTRETDMVARLGGDEFAVVMKRMRSEEDALRKGQEICTAFQRSHATAQMPMRVSGGIAIWNAEAAIEEAVKQAEEALHAAKEEMPGHCRLARRSGGAAQASKGE